MPQAAAAFERAIKALDQRFIVEGLTKETDGASFAHARFDPFLRKRRNEDDGYRAAAREQMALQFDSAQAWHLNVRDQTERSCQLVGLQEILGR